MDDAMDYKKLQYAKEVERIISTMHRSDAAKEIVEFAYGQNVKADKANARAEAAEAEAEKLRGLLRAVTGDNLDPFEDDDKCKFCGRFLGHSSVSCIWLTAKKAALQPGDGGGE